MKGKHFAKAYWSRTRIVSAILSIALLFGCITFSSAWLIAKNEPEGPVVNEFTGSMLEITLTPNEDQGPYKLVPGVTYELSEEKAPKITVDADSVECYLFVVFREVGTKVSGSNRSFSHFLNYNYNTNECGYLTFMNYPDDEGNPTMVWRKSDVNDPVPWEEYVFYYRKELSEGNYQNYILSSDVPQTFDVINRNTNGKPYFTIPSTLTKTEVNPNNLSSNPYVTFTGYSIQTLGLKPNGGSEEDVKTAWTWIEAAIESGNTKEVVLE